MERRFLFAVLLLLSVQLCAQEANRPAAKDTLFEWRSRFPDYSVTEVSPSGKWAAVTQWNNMVSDTVMIVNTDKYAATPIKFSGMPRIYFGPSNHALTSGVGKASWWDLTKGRAIHYKRVKNTVLLAATGQYAILGSDGVLKVMGIDGSVINAAENVKELISDGSTALYYLKKEGIATVLYRWGRRSIRLFETAAPIIRTELAASGKYLTVQLQEGMDGGTVTMLIDAVDGYKHVPLPNALPPTSFVSFSEAGDADLFFIRIQHIEPQQDNPVEIWYANDGDLRSRILNMRNTFEYGLYNAKSAVYSNITKPGYPSMVNIGSARHFIVFNATSDQNYIRWIPDIDASVYDAGKDLLHHIGRVREEINISPDSSLLVFRTDSDQWILYNMSNYGCTKVGGASLKNPVFSDNDNIYFESSSGIWQYDVKNSRLRQMPGTARLQCQIINKKIISHNTDYTIYTASTDSKGTAVIKLYDPVNAFSSIGIVKGTRVETVLSPTPDRISDIKYSDDLKLFVYRTENYNMYPEVRTLKLLNNKNGTVYSHPLHAQAAKQVRRDIVNYKDKEGFPLQGLLYYPAGFNPDRKYPVIVNIYQIQSDAKNEYFIPGGRSTKAFDLRALTNKGYFVYLPDIRTGGSAGPGMSALDCVHRALDAIVHRTYIEAGKVGLMGHSHGGYETNFIATHSDRFAAYVSGAGNSDLIRSYFSLNYNFSSPFYWQYENGQYEMKKPFYEDKHLYFVNSPVNFAEAVNAPVLLWAGKKDQNIAWDQVMEFYVALRRYKKDAIALFYPNQGHDTGVNTPEMRDLNERVLEWWDYFLKGRKHIPWIEKQIKKDSTLSNGS